MVSIERLNREIRDREKIMRGLKKEDTPILTGYQIYHNFIKPHMALKGKTPAQKAKIYKESKEAKWLSLIKKGNSVPQN